jgi:hypothetical protein
MTSFGGTTPSEFPNFADFEFDHESPPGGRRIPSALLLPTQEGGTGRGNHPRHSVAGYWPDQNGSSKGSRCPMSSRMPLSGDKLRDRTNLPLIDYAYAKKSTTLCIARGYTVPPFRRRRRKKGRWQFRRVVDAKLLCRQHRNHGKAANVDFIVGWTRKRETSISDRLKLVRRKQALRKLQCCLRDPVGDRPSMLLRRPLLRAHHPGLCAHDFLLYTYDAGTLVWPTWIKPVFAGLRRALAMARCRLIPVMSDDAPHAGIMIGRLAS